MESFWIPLFSSFPCELYEVTLSLRDSRANSTTANPFSNKKRRGNSCSQFTKSAATDRTPNTSFSYAISLKHSKRHSPTQLNHDSRIIRKTIEIRSIGFLLARLKSLFGFTSFIAFRQSIRILFFKSLRHKRSQSKSTRNQNHYSFGSYPLYLLDSLFAYLLAWIHFWRHAFLSCSSNRTRLL